MIGDHHTCPSYLPGVGAEGGGLGVGGRRMVGGKSGRDLCFWRPVIPISSTYCRE